MSLQCKRTEQKHLMPKPVCTLSPICSSDIVTIFPLSSLTLEMEGKHFFFFSKTDKMNC